MMNKLRQTPSQTVGPFFAYSLTAAQYGYDYNSIANGSLLVNDTDDERIYITGSIFDGEGNTVPDALIELFHADANGKYISEYPDKFRLDISFKGFGRLGTGTNQQHQFTFITLKPGSIKGQAPHVNVILFMRGSLKALYTRIYFNDEANEQDLVLNTIDEARRHTLIAKPNKINGRTYHFDIYIQGENETVFFDI